MNFRDVFILDEYEIEQKYNLDEQIALFFNKYRFWIDPKDKMQMSNLKFVESYIAYQKKKARDGWKQDCVDFLKGVIKLQQELLTYIGETKAKYK